MNTIQIDESVYDQAFEHAYKSDPALYLYPDGIVRAESKLSPHDDEIMVADLSHADNIFEAYDPKTRADVASCVYGHLREAIAFGDINGNLFVIP